MIYGGNGSLNQHPLPLPRKTSALDRYYRNGAPGLSAGLGMVFADLPNMGHNLRLYTYDPPGTPYYKPPDQGYLYNTGHYDVSIPSGPCGSPDPKGFNDWDSMDAYAKQRGEFLVLVTRADLTALCSYVPPKTVTPVPPTIQPTATVPPPSTPPPTGSSEGNAFNAWLQKNPGGTFDQWRNIITATTTTTSTGTGGGTGGGSTGGGAGSPYAPPPADNTLLYVGIAALAYVMFSS